MTSCTFNLEPLAQSELTNSANLPNLNYVNQDFSSMKTRLISYIEQKFADDFTNFVESDLGIILIENWAFLADTLSFKMDQIVNELFIDTVYELDNIFRLSKLVGFTPTPPIAGKAMFSATIQTPLTVDLAIPAGLVIDTTASGQAITFELFPADSENNPIFDQDIIIGSGQYTNTAIVGLEGETKQDIFTGDATVNQVYTLTTSSVLLDSVRVDIDGQRWDLVDYFTDSKGRNEYRVEYDSTWNCYLIFGNGTAGRIPNQGSQILVTYRVGGGTIGNIITGFISTQRGFDVPGFGYAVPINFTNYTKGDYGYNGDTIDDIKRKLPAYVRSQDRAVTGNDYKSLTDLYVSPYNGQIGKSLAVLRNYGCAGNIVDLYILAKSGENDLQEASDQLKIELNSYLDTKKMITDFLCIKDGVVILVDISIDVIVGKFFRKFKDEIESKITNKISDLFLLPNWEYGQSLKDTDILKSLSNINEINDIVVSFTTSDPDNGGSIVTAKYYEIIRKDVLTINVVFE